MSWTEILLNLVIGTAGSLLAAAIWKYSPRTYFLLKQIPIKAASQDVVGKARMRVNNITANCESWTRSYPMAFLLLIVLLLITLLITSFEFDPSRPNLA